MIITPSIHKNTKSVSAILKVTSIEVEGSTAISVNCDSLIFQNFISLRVMNGALTGSVTGGPGESFGSVANPKGGELITLERRRLTTIN